MTTGLKGQGHHVLPRRLAKEALHACRDTILGLDADAIPNGAADFWRRELGNSMSQVPGFETRAENVPRRIWDIEQHHERRSIACHWIEAALIACDLDTHSIPTLPGSWKLAKEMAAIYHERHPDVNAKQLANELMTFTKAVTDHDWLEDEPLVIPDDEVLRVNNLEFLQQIKEVTAWPEKTPFPRKT